MIKIIKNNFKQYYISYVYIDDKIVNRIVACIVFYIIKKKAKKIKIKKKY